MTEGTIWFKRLVKDCEDISGHLKFKRIKYGFYRVYWTGGGECAYIHEVYKWMPYKGYDIDEKDIRFQSQKYYEEYEDAAELTLNLKNYVEGYWDAFKTIQKRVYMLKNNKEFYKSRFFGSREVAVAVGKYILLELFGALVTFLRQSLHRFQADPLETGWHFCTNLRRR